MSISRKIKRSLRGDISPRATSLEAARRLAVALRRWRERVMLRSRNGRVPSEEYVAQMTTAFAALSATQLLTHFRDRQTPKFFSGFKRPDSTSPDKANERVSADAQAVLAHRWPLLGFGKLDFGAEIDWSRDPVSGICWPLEFHVDVALVRGDGSDVRVLWELNRLGQLLTLGRAYALTDDEQLAGEFFAQTESWRQQNAVGVGPNWACAMEVALRAMNLLAAFHLFRNSHVLDEQRLAMLLALFDAHGHHIRRNLEYSYIATGNHYLSDVIGLLWLGIYLPELAAASAWRAFGLREMLRELEKQVLADGAHYEFSTGYHRFVTELFLYSFILCRENGIEIEEKYWQRLRSMLEYIRAYLRPDGSAPLIGDSDGGRVLPLFQRDGDDHAYLVELGAALFREPNFKIRNDPPDELFWLLGSEGVQTYSELETAQIFPAGSAILKDAGTVVLRDKGLYLLMSASGAGLRGRGAHGHNDALSIEVSVGDTAFIIDPGSYCYTANLRERNLFRSTAYHSTVEVDHSEQNTTDEGTPFILGGEARPRLLECEIGPERELASAEHYGYLRLSQPATHRRTVQFDKPQRCWFISDKLTGAGVHDLNFRFHFAPELESSVRADGIVEVWDKMNGARLLIVASDMARAELEPCFSARHYGAKTPSISCCWAARAALPYAAHFVLIPVGAGENEAERLTAVLDIFNAALPISSGGYALPGELRDYLEATPPDKQRDSLNPISTAR